MRGVGRSSREFRRKTPPHSNSGLSIAELKGMGEPSSSHNTRASLSPHAGSPARESQALSKNQPLSQAGIKVKNIGFEPGFERDFEHVI